MRGSSTALATALTTSLLLAAWSGSAGASCQARSGKALRPLVELYTAEGCNLCPAADAWLSAAARRERRVSWLAFHVDYWDSVGWVDRYAAPSHGQRQQYRLESLGRSALFTPQVIVGADVPADWRGAAMGELLEERRRQIAPAALAMSASGQPDGRLRVDMQAQLHGDRIDGVPLLWLALYEDGLQTAVAAGENAGRTLRHDRVVRKLAGPWKLDSPAWSGYAVMDLPDGLQPERAGLVLFAETPGDGRGLQSLEQALSSCATANAP